MATGEYSDYTVEELREELRERELPNSGNKAELVARLELDDKHADDAEDAKEGGVTANAVTELDEDAKTGPVRRREARDERLAGEAELYERTHREDETVQQSGPAADIAEQQASER